MGLPKVSANNLTFGLSVPQFGMQERKKRRIVIASVLKPVDDARMFEKLAQSLAAIAEVHVIGYPTSQAPAQPSAVVLHPVEHFSRISIKRLLMPWRILRKIRQLHPSTLVITTHELLAQALIVNLTEGARLVYDVQENYARNILYTNAFPLLLRPFVAAYVRLKELICSPFINTFLLAEESYRDELRFMRGKEVVVENKSRRIVRTRQNDNEIRLLFSGTLNEGTGVFSAIDLAKRLHVADPRIRLAIAGYCSLAQTYERLIAATRALPFVTIVGGDHLVPHDKIVQLIGESDAGIIAYSITPATCNSRPTKIFEYLAGGLSILTVDHKPWVKLLNKYTTPVIFDPANPDVPTILAALTRRHNSSADSSILWENEEKKLLSLFA